MPPGLVQLSFEVSSSSGIVKAGSARPRFAEDGVGHIVAATEVAAAKAARKTDFVENIVEIGTLKQVVIAVRARKMKVVKEKESGW